METFIVLVVVAISVIFFLNYKTPKTKKSRKQFYEEQESQVQAGGYFPRKLLNKSESESYKAIISFLYSHEDLKRRYKVFSQVSLGEFVGNKDSNLYRAINSKRVDFLITDTYFNPKLAIEINGSGHYLDSNAEKRDSIKQSAVENAGVTYRSIEIQKTTEAKFAINIVMKNYFFENENNI